MKPWKIYLLSSLVACLPLGCSDDDGPTDTIDEDTPFPQSIPSTTAQTVDLSGLSSGGLAPAGLCHASTATVVTLINLGVVLHLTVPTATFSACIQQTPKYQGNQVWTWTASGGTGQNAFRAELTGTVVGNETVNWAMRINGTPDGYDDFLWFDGEADYGARAGVWHYYDPTQPEMRSEVVRSDWSLPVSSSDDRSISFTILQAGHDQEGDALVYSVSGDQIGVSYSDDSAGTSITADWNRVSGIGGFTGADGKSCCWGGPPTFPDETCTP